MQALPLSGKLSYHGGNGPLFSLLLSLVRSCDEQTFSRDVLCGLLRDWGASLGSQLPLDGTLEHDLDLVAGLLRTMGLVRVFEPLPPSSKDAAPQILVMRCLFSRYIHHKLVAAAESPLRVLPLLVEGILQQAGHELFVEEAPGANLRSDEYVLALRDQPSVPLVKPVRSSAEILDFVAPRQVEPSTAPVGPDAASSASAEDEGGFLAGLAFDLPEEGGANAANMAAASSSAFLEMISSEQLEAVLIDESAPDEGEAGASSSPATSEAKAAPSSDGGASAPLEKTPPSADQEEQGKPVVKAPLAGRFGSDGVGLSLVTGADNSKQTLAFEKVDVSKIEELVLEEEKP